MENNYLTLILTRRCKHNCPFCLVDKSGGSLNIETAKKTLDFFLRQPGEEKTIKFFGGEPLLEFGLLKKSVDYCGRINKRFNKRINFIVSTTGSLLDKRILKFIEESQVELVVDSFHIKKIKKDILKSIFSLPFLTLTINIPPASAADLYAEFQKFYAQGFRRFNFLPSYYARWPRRSIKALERELDKISVFYKKAPETYFKNVALSGEVPLFNSCLTCDVSGGLYSSNIILLKDFSEHKKDFFLANIHDVKKVEDLRLRNGRLSEIVKKSFPARVLKDTRKIDKVLNLFVKSLYRQVNVADIKLGDTCNNRCKFCVRETKRQRASDKEAEEIRRNLLDARRECQGVVFTGGEVTIRPDICDWVSYAKRLGYERIQIQSNGRMLAYKSFCLKVIEAGANEFAIAIHGHIPELHDYLTSSQGSFYQTVQAIKNIKELGLPVITNTVVNKPNYRHLPQIARLLAGLGVNQFQFAFVHALGRAGDNFDSIVPRVTLVMPYVKEGLEIGIRAGLRVMTEAIPYCLMGEYGDYVSEKIMPSVKIFEFDNEVIDFDKVRPMLSKLKGPDCSECKCFSVCEGPWREYPERFGWNEFRPVKDKE